MSRAKIHDWLIKVLRPTWHNIGHFSDKWTDRGDVVKVTDSYGYKELRCRRGQHCSCEGWLVGEYDTRVSCTKTGEQTEMSSSDKLGPRNSVSDGGQDWTNPFAWGEKQPMRPLLLFLLSLLCHIILGTVQRCGLLLQIYHVAWSVCWANRSAVQERTNWLTYDIPFRGLTQVTQTGIQIRRTHSPLQGVSTRWCSL